MLQKIILSKCSIAPSVSSLVFQRSFTVPSNDTKNFQRIKAPQFRLKNTPFTWMPEKERETYAKFLQYYFPYDYSWNKNVALENKDSTLDLINNKTLHLKPFESTFITHNFYAGKKPPENLIQTMGFHYHLSDWPLWGNFYVNDEMDFRKLYAAIYKQPMDDIDFKQEIIEIFENIMQALYKKTSGTLSSFVFPSFSNIKEDKTFSKHIQPCKVYSQNEEKYSDAHRHTSLSDESKKDTELLNVDNNDVIYLPENANRNILWDIRRIVIEREAKSSADINERKMFIHYTVPVVALYKKNVLYKSVQDLEYLTKNTPIPFIPIPEEYGYSRPIRIVALIQFVNELSEMRGLSSTRYFFGFHVQIPKAQEFLQLKEDE